MAERGGAINFSLSNLKQCVRVLSMNATAQGTGGEQQHVPFRGSKLTYALRDVFTEQGHRTVVVGTLSPTPTDVEHTLNTLQHVSMMRGELRLTHNTSDGKSRLHSKLQDARESMLRLHAFSMHTAVGGTIMKKYEKENVKYETFIDSRWHAQAMAAKVEEDLWVLSAADAEVIHMLTWKQEQWEKVEKGNMQKWDPIQVQQWLHSLGAHSSGLPSTMTGQQLLRLTRSKLMNLAGTSGPVIFEALQEHKSSRTETMEKHRLQNQRMYLMGHSKERVVAEAQATPLAEIQPNEEQP